MKSFTTQVAQKTNSFPPRRSAPLGRRAGPFKTEAMKVNITEVIVVDIYSEDQDQIKQFKGSLIKKGITPVDVWVSSPNRFTAYYPKAEKSIINSIVAAIINPVANPH